MKSKLNRFTTVLLVLVLLVGISVMLYPTVSDWWNARVQSYAIANYDQSVETLDDSYKEELLAAAYAYNQALTGVAAPFIDASAAGDYYSILDVAGNGILGYVTIPKIKIELPIYHGTSAEVLNIAIGHLEGSSFPVGGESTHAVISGHRGLPSARLFSNLDQLVEGDTFTVTVLDQVLTYEVENIYIVLPHETERLNIVPGEDYLTLLTCTPYGINTHRLLVRAHRIETEYARTVKVVADAIQLDSTVAAPVIAAPLFLLLFLYWMIGGRRRKRPSKEAVLSALDAYDEFEWKDGES